MSLPRTIRDAAGEASRIGDLSSDHFKAALHDRQKIIEIMGHAAGKLADRFHLLRLAQQFFCLPARLVFGFQLARADFSSCVRCLTAASSASVKLRSSTNSRLRSVTSMLTPTTRYGFPASS